MSEDHLSNRYLGALAGLAVGDALGAPFEGAWRGTFEATGMDGGRRRRWAGYWTDDTAMALCLAESLVECGFDPADQMRRYVRWKNEGYMSSAGRAYGMGRTTRRALMKFEETGDPFAGSEAPDTAGNGSLMRLAPIPMYMLHDCGRAKELAATMSKTTHAAVQAVDACRYMTGLIAGALRGESKELLLSDLYSPVYNYWLFHHVALTKKIDDIARGVYKDKSADEIETSAYVVHTLEAALWCFHRTTSFREGALLAVNLGRDADTTAAVYGQLGGAYYGYEAIPAEWREKLARRELIEDLALKLLTATRQSLRHFT